MACCRISTLVLVLSLVFAGVSTAAPKGEKSRQGRIDRSRRWNKVHIRQLGRMILGNPKHTLLKDTEYRFFHATWAQRNRRQNPRRPFPWRTGGNMEMGHEHVGSLLNMYSQAMDKHGLVHRDRVVKRFGPKTAARLDKLIASSRGEKPRLDGARWDALLVYTNEQVQRALVHRRNLVPKMPAFSDLVRTYGKGEPLKGLRVMMRGHILGNTAGLLLKAGLTPELTEVRGKTYSFDARVGTLLHLSRFNVLGTLFRSDPRFADNPGDPIFRSQRDKVRGAVRSHPSVAEFYEERRMAARLIRQLRTIQNPEKIKRPVFLMVDDGADQIMLVARLLSQPRFRRYAHLFAAVEQTTKGLRRLEKLQRAGKLPFSVVSMADCWGKSKYGSPMFGYAVAKETIRLLDDLHRPGGRLETDHRLQIGGVPKPRRAVLFGFGHITAQVARYLRKAGYTDISVYDRREGKRDEARAAKFKVIDSKEKALGQADLLVSCTGETTVREGDLKHLPDGAILVNGGSPGEFKLKSKPGVAFQNPVHFEGGSGFVGFHGRMIPTDGADRHQVFRTSNFKEVLVARAGSVVNFPLQMGNRRSGRLIPARYVQLEIGLLYLGMLQAAKGDTPGIHRLEMPGQRRLVSKVQRQLARTGETLLDPRW